MQHRVILIVAVLTAWLAAISTGVSYAQTGVDTRIDVVLVIDNSGSMEQNDPHNMRISAARLFTNLAAPGDQIGIVSMGDRDSTKAVMSLSTVDAVNQLTWESLRTIKAPDKLSGWTYMGEALDLAGNVLDNAGKHNLNRAVIFLTDGKPTYRDEDRAGQEAKFSAAVERLKRDRVKVFGIALGGDADAELLRTAISSPTAGKVWTAQNADQLLSIYTDIMAQLQDGRYVDSYAIVGNVETFLANVNPRQQIRQVNFVFPAQNAEPPEIQSLLLPSTPFSGLDKLSRFKDPNWSMFTARPEYVPKFNGEWRASLKTPGPQTPMVAVIKSDLRARVVEPVPSIPDDESAVRYYPAGRPLLIRAGARNKADKFEKQLGLWVQMREPQSGQGFTLLDSGADQDLAPEDGIASGLIDGAMQPGTYRMLVNVSPTDSHLRLDKLYDIVVEPLPQMEVAVAPQGMLQVNEPVRLRAHFALDGKPASVDAAEITAAVKQDGKVLTTVPLKAAGNGSWEGEYLPARSGAYSFGLTAHVDWQAPDRGPRHYTDYTEVGYQAKEQPLVEVSVSDDGSRVDDLHNGIQRTVSFRSFSDAPVEVKLDVANLPLGKVYPATIKIGAHEEGKRTVTISTHAPLTSGDWNAQLRVSTDPNVRLSATDLPVSFTVRSFLQRNRLLIALLGIAILLISWRRTRSSMRDWFIRNAELLRYGGAR